MRTTIRLEDDVLAAAEKLRRERHIGLAEAINELARAGMARTPGRRKAFKQRTAPVGLRLDVTNVAETLDMLDERDRSSEAGRGRDR